MAGSTTLRVESTTICQTETSVRPRQLPRSDSLLPMPRADSPQPIQGFVNSRFWVVQYLSVEHRGPTPTLTTAPTPNLFGDKPLTHRYLLTSKSTSQALTDKIQLFVFSRIQYLMPTGQSSAFRASSSPCHIINSCSRMNRVNCLHFLKLRKIRPSSPT